MAHDSEHTNLENVGADGDDVASRAHAAPPDDSRIRMLLLQARRDVDAMGQHEVECFSRHLGVPLERLEIFDILTRPFEELYETLDDPNVRVFIGGSGDYSVSKPGPASLERFVHEAIPRIVASGRPTFGSCWGLHTLVLGLGGHVEAVKPGEVGTFDVRLTNGNQDPLFAHMPQGFRAQMGHNDWVTKLPPGAVSLCENDASSFQAVRFGDGPVYGLQFHAELSVEDNRARYLHYIENYGGDVEPDGEGCPLFGASPQANTLLARFRTLYCTPNGRSIGHGEAPEGDD